MRHSRESSTMILALGVLTLFVIYGQSATTTTEHISSTMLTLQYSNVNENQSYTTHNVMTSVTTPDDTPNSAMYTSSTFVPLQVEPTKDSHVKTIIIYASLCGALAILAISLAITVVILVRRRKSPASSELLIPRTLSREDATDFVIIKSGNLQKSPSRVAISLDRKNKHGQTFPRISNSSKTKRSKSKNKAGDLFQFTPTSAPPGGCLQKYDISNDDALYEQHVDPACRDAIAQLENSYEERGGGGNVSYDPHTARFIVQPKLSQHQQQLELHQLSNSPNIFDSGLSTRTLPNACPVVTQSRNSTAGSVFPVHAMPGRQSSGDAKSLRSARNDAAVARNTFGKKDRLRLFDESRLSCDSTKLSLRQMNNFDLLKSMDASYRRPGALTLNSRPSGNSDRGSGGGDCGPLVNAGRTFRSPRVIEANRGRMDFYGGPPCSSMSKATGRTNQFSTIRNRPTSLLLSRSKLFLQTIDVDVDRIRDSYHASRRARPPLPLEDCKSQASSKSTDLARSEPFLNCTTERRNARPSAVERLYSDWEGQSMGSDNEGSVRGRGMEEAEGCATYDEIDELRRRARIKRIKSSAASSRSSEPTAGRINSMYATPEDAEYWTEGTAPPSEGGRSYLYYSQPDLVSSCGRSDTRGSRARGGGGGGSAVEERLYEEIKDDVQLAERPKLEYSV